MKTEAEAIKAEKYLSFQEIEKHLENVEYIIMVAPAPKEFKNTPIHFSIFLNTSDNLPKDIQEAVLNKFLKEQNIKKPEKLLSQLMPVGFAITSQETPMPMLLIKPQDVQNINHTSMFVMDFVADSDSFQETKEKDLTGWSYSYN